jgi:hypothetical protein
MAHNYDLAADSLEKQLSTNLQSVLQRLEAGSSRAVSYLMRKLSLVSLVPFISSLIHTGVTPRPVHLRDLFFLD